MLYESFRSLKRQAAPGVDGVVVADYEHKRDAEDFLARLGPRLREFCLTLAEEKSGLVKFNRWEPDDSGRSRDWSSNGSTGVASARAWPGRSC